MTAALREAAHEEFLSCGYQKASLHKIAESRGHHRRDIANARYKNKDALFVSLLQDFMNKLNDYFAPCGGSMTRQKAARHTAGALGRPSILKSASI